MSYNADKKVYDRAKRKQAKGQKLTYTERQRLDRARDRRVAREEQSAKIAHAKKLNESSPQTANIAKTKNGWRVRIQCDHPGGPWSSKDELEIVTRKGKAVWVTLVRLHFSGNDPKHSEWWSFSFGRQSRLIQHVSEPVFVAPPPLEEKQVPSGLDEDDYDHVSTGAGAAYLAIAKAKRARTAQAAGLDAEGHRT